MRHTLLARVVVVAFGVALVAACGDDGGSASDRVCDARAELRDQIDAVIADVQAGNLDEARDGLDDVRSAYDDLKADVEDLDAQQRDELQPEVDQLQDDVAALGDAESLAELSDSVDTAFSQAESIVDQIAGSLDCG